jgi:hypothetical protein
MWFEEKLRNISPEALGRYGASDIAYIKKVVVGGAPTFEVHSADGTQLAAFDQHDLAVATTLQNELVPVSVH